MKFIDLFKLSTRMFKARTSRTLLTILGMSIGIAAILFLVSLGEGLRTTLLERITTSDSLLTLDVSEAKSGVVSLNDDMIKKIQAMPGVDQVSPAFQITTQGHLDDLSADMVTIGTDPSFLKLGGINAINGKILDNNNPNGVVVSSAMATVFGKTPAEMIGKQITFSFFLPSNSLAAAGENSTPDQNASTDSSGSQSTLNRIDSQQQYTIVGVVDGSDNIVYVNANSLSSLNINEYGQLKVKCHSSAQMTTVRDAILGSGLLVSSLSDTVDQANKIFNVVRIILMLFGAIALLVSAIGMFNTMTITLLERTEEIGIMKSIGASDFTISVMFFLESGIMGFLGGLAGVCIGWIGGRIFNMIVNFIASRFGGVQVNLFLSPMWLVLGVIFSSAMVGFGTGYVPARRASKTDPLDALRYK
jgi:putative ABC transport system permease protein